MATVAEDMTAPGPVAFARGNQDRPVVAGHYEVDLDAPLGAGGMALVYQGRDLRTRRQVALKTLRREYLQDPEARARFRREARTMAFLAHRNVIKVYDLFEDDDAPWVVIEFAPGRPLKDEIAERGPYTVEETGRLLEQIGSALDHLHGRGLVHLDVKPQNLIVDTDLSIKLIDFGLAQHAESPQEMIGGSAFGTAAYLSPEQARGEPVGFATDVYALGCVVYEMLTGQPPFAADATSQLKDDVIRAHIDENPAPPSSLTSLPEWVDEVVLTALAKRPEDRYRDCGSFAATFWEGIEDPDIAPGTVTARVFTPPVTNKPVVGTYEEVFPAAKRPRKTPLHALYCLVGRLLRRTGKLQQFLWRATVALLVGNVLLAGLLYADRGEVPGLIAGGTSLQADANARVTTDGLNMRADPGRDAAVIGRLAIDQEVRVTGPSQKVDGETWWPVRAVIDNEPFNGFVAGGWIEPVGGPKDVWFNRAVDEVKSWPDRLLEEIGIG
jgi:tRNA A-37 threonylcarbamoyl transferase component Bud32